MCCLLYTSQSGGTVNGLFLREKLFDYIDVVVAPVLIGGKAVSYTHLMYQLADLHITHLCQHMH